MLKFADVFSGIGGFRMGLEEYGNECVYTVEYDDKAQKAHHSVWGEGESWLDDVRKLNTDDIPNFELLCGGFPCFPQGQKIVTDTKLTAIEDIGVGDNVLTHNGRYRKVLHTMEKQYYGYLYEIVCKYYKIPIKATDEHPFYTKRGWVEAKDLKEDDYVSMPLNHQSMFPAQIKYSQAVNQHKTVEKETNLPLKNSKFWELIGYWLAEGCTVDKRGGKEDRKQFRVVLASTDDKIRYIEPLLQDLGIKYYLTDEPTGYKLHIINKELWLYVKQFTEGKKAKDKIIPEFVHNLTVELLKGLIKGYFTGNGSSSKGYVSFTSTSLPLLESVQRILLKTDKRLYSLNKYRDAGIAQIEGRIVNAVEYYILTDGAEQGRYVEFTKEHVFFKVDKIKKERVEDLTVYNFEVEEDNSYCLPMVAVHNCAKFSMAGDRKGFESDDPRATLFYELMRIAKAKKPKYLLFENVKGLMNHDDGRSFRTILYEMDKLGYDVEWQVINAKDFGYPVLRERVFIIGHLRGECTEKVFPITNGVKSNDCETSVYQFRRGGFRKFNGYCPTLTASMGTGGNNVPFIIDNGALRKFTPRELFRLQGIKEEYIDKLIDSGLPDSALYERAGRTVFIPIIKEIAKRLK